jgi:hypothetical protein
LITTPLQYFEKKGFGSSEALAQAYPIVDGALEKML